MKMWEKDGMIYIELSDGMISMTKEQALVQQQHREEAKKYIEKWLDLYGDQKLSIEDAQANDSDFHARMELFYDEARKTFESQLKADADPGQFVSALNIVFSEMINACQRQLELPGITKKDRINHQIKILEDLRVFVTKVNMALQGEKKMAEFRICTDLHELVEKFGDSNRLRLEYEQQLKNAPNKKLMIERRIATLESVMERFSSRLHFSYPTPQDRKELEFGQYYRTGYAWMIAGYNATWADLDLFTQRNVSLNVVVPLEKRTEAYVMLIHQLVMGAALAKHVAFLYEVKDQTKTTGDVIPGVQRTVHKLHFQDLHGVAFERLAFAYIRRSGKYGDEIKWYGESGSDGGSDIWAENGGNSWCFQCKNYPRLSLVDIRPDIDKLIRKGTIPIHYVVIAGGSVSHDAQEKIIAYCKLHGINSVQVWTGVEFEETLRNDAPELIKRFFDGDPFPEAL